MKTMNPVSVSCSAKTGQPDDYLQVTPDDVTIGGTSIGKIQDEDILRWAARVIADFASTGKLAPVPG